MKELICTCGDTESQHVDNCEQCVVPECGCKEFEDANFDPMNNQDNLEATYGNMLKLWIAEDLFHVLVKTRQEPGLSLELIAETMKKVFEPEELLAIIRYL